jgi:hypothetical protein
VLAKYWVVWRRARISVIPWYKWNSESIPMMVEYQRDCRLLLLIKTGYCWSLKQVTASHWNRLLLVNETGYYCSLKRVTNGHWNMLLLLIETGYWWSLKHVTASHWNVLLLSLKQVTAAHWNRYCCHWNRFLLIITTQTFDVKAAGFFLF